jgi:hypothetical protein
MAPAGCGLSDPALLSEEQELRDIRSSRPGPLGWNVEVWPVVLAPAVEEKEGLWPLSVETGAFRDGVVAALKEARVFREVAAGSSHEAELSLRLKVNAAQARYLGGNGYRIPWFLVWCILSSVPACFIADEEYEGEMEVEASLTEKATGAALWADRIPVKFAGALDHFQRGISFWDLFLPGPFLTGADADCLAKVLVPHLSRRVDLELARRMAAGVPERKVDFLVAVGAGRLRGAAAAEDPDPSPAFCVSDAKAFASSFKKREGRTEAVLLLGNAATAEACRETLSGLAKKRDVSIRDLVLYFSASGLLLEGPQGRAEPALVFAPGKGGAPGGAHPRCLTVSELLRLAQAVPAESRLVVLDAGFRGTAGRVSRTAGAPAPSSRAAQAFPSGKDVPALLSACGPEETALESPDLEAGLFTSLLLARLGPASDADGDGRVLAGEILEELSWNVLRESRFLGGTSTPFASGEAVLFRCKPRPKAANAGPGGEKR